MISQLNSSAIRSLHASNFGESKEAGKTNTNITKQGDTSKIERIKEAIDSGEYKINLEELSKKIAQELL
ncbi:anti-sigma-28 factor flgm family protein [Sulfurimonas hongkongensis]|uniref:Anti-sigma-28 factor flgm family protein n=1 Tax=Sulfurimonas hongkongensis TaxID=1172190 RepID=T0JGI9_9BACT|nr:flagellar biosynthesis anti-sigma factor FlgM [Sulfurimonas hongkongensis]EQB40180.1 anti-sigma-28 factor flgm family protein [Sulfurimonas hongkongensis]